MTSFIPLRSDIFNFTTQGFEFPAPGPDTVKVFPDVTIASDLLDAIDSELPNSVLINAGNIVSRSHGVFFDFTAANSIITNTAEGLMLGVFAVEMTGTGYQTFNNFGKVISTVAFGVLFSGNAQSVVVNNHGSILAAEMGIQNGAASGVINNFHLISASGVNGVGIHLNTPNLLTTTINNAPAAIIKGTMDAIAADGGMFSIHNLGRVHGDISDNANLHDVVINHGTINGNVDLGGGNDLFNGTGGKSGPVFGGDGRDRLIGGSGKDLLHGDDGNDKLTGGPGADQFFFDSTLNPVTNVDTITDFTSLQGDRIVLSDADFAGLGSFGRLSAPHFHIGRPTNGNPQIDYNHSTGFLFYDPDGNGGAAPVHFATLANHATIKAGDFFLIA
jgi:Ca2+-binding RTX toxin-like protein